ncbi:hypothetical protein LINGRAHAP2_LOCUS24495 [Linum grandiflorum]
MWLYSHPDCPLCRTCVTRSLEPQSDSNSTIALLSVHTSSS